MATNPNITHFPTPPLTQPEFKARPLAQKLAQILANIHRVPKNGRNDFHRYDYVYESDLVDHIRDKLARQGVALFPSVREHATTEVKDARNKTSFLTTVTLDITMIDGQSGDQITTTWVGQGMDAGDKGYYKAYTGALKYFLLKTFMISTGDDPEQDAGVVAANQNTTPKPTPVAPAPPTQARASTPTLAAPQPDNHVAASFRALLEESVEAAVCDEFQSLYLLRMSADALADIDDAKLNAMCRRLRSMNTDARKRYIEGVLEDNAASKS